MMSTTLLTGFYDYRLVALSILLAIAASYAALDLAERVTFVRGSIRLIWLCGGAITMGAGIWAMHYVGMEAFHLPVPVLYDWPTVLLSLIAAILGAGAALFFVSRSTMGLGRTLLGSIFLGSSIAAMHYIGMDAMRLPAMCDYAPWLVWLSIFLAVGISFEALRIAFSFREDAALWSIRKAGRAVVLGLAIPVMHYVGMAAASFEARPSIQGNLDHAVNVSSLGLAGITVTVLLLLIATFLTSFVDRRFSLQSLKLEESQQQMQMIYDNMVDGVGVLDKDRNLVHINPAACRMLGLSDRTQTRAETAATFDMLWPDGRIIPWDEWPSALASQGIFLNKKEMLIRRKDTGKCVVIEMTTTPIKNNAGETMQVIVSYHDITDQRLDLEARARLAAIVDSSEDAIIGKSERGVITSWNKAAEKIFGYTAEEMIGHSILQLVPADREEEEKDFLNRIKRGEVIDHVETIRKRKNGKQIFVSLTISPIRDRQGKIVGASKIARDVTERKQLERQLYQSQKMQAIGQLSGGIAHDFNNLLGVIIGNLSLVERQVLGNDTTLKYVRSAQKASWRGADLIRRLMTVSSDEDLNPSTVLLNHSIQNVLELAAQVIGPDIELTVHLADSLPPVFVDPAGLESALLNLVVNARDAMPKGGRITITSELKELDKTYPPVKTGELKTGTYVDISLADSGSGMSADTLERVFEPFFTTKPRGKGTGLGLAMVYGFTKQSGGTVRIYSELGFGTTVTLYLPLAHGEAKHVSTIEVMQPATRSGATVLVVDDEPDLLEVASEYLKEMGYVPVQALNGAEALAKIAERRDIELIVTDIIMPGGMNGVELVEQARRLVPTIKVIYSSGFSADALADRSGTTVDGLLLHKPYKRSEFAEMIHRVMQGSGLHTAWNPKKNTDGAGENERGQ